MPDDTVYFGFVVEGDGEVEAAPLLVRRIAHELCHFYNLATTQPVRMSRSKIVRPGEIERAVRLARLNNRAAGPVTIIFDADDDCPAHLTPILRCRLDAVLTPG